MKLDDKFGRVSRAAFRRFGHTSSRSTSAGVGSGGSSWAGYSQVVAELDISLT
jgi:hypothetical protein